MKNKKFLVKYRCNNCNKEFTRLFKTGTILLENGRWSRPNGKTGKVRCPHCRKKDIKELARSPIQY